MRTQRILLTSAIIGLAGLGLPWTARADDVKIEVQQPAPGVAQTAPPATVIYAPPPAGFSETLRADDIEAHQVRARTIYANKIEADQVQGMVHQGDSVKIGDTRGDIKAPEVVAGVIYADKIKANSVSADQIFVRDLDRK